MRRAGYTGEPPELADALFDAIVAGPSAVGFSVDDWAESFARVKTPGGKVRLAIPELFDELDGLARESAPGTGAEYPFVLAAGERRSFTANTIIRNPEWRRKDRAGALRMNPADAARLRLADGGRARLTTRRGSVEVVVELSDRMQPGHLSLPNGQGTDYPGIASGASDIGVSPNELTATEDRDWLAGTPWHKYIPARLEAL
jgi:anaerobic selenocysteine-containing dehydrogenase